MTAAVPATQVWLIDLGSDRKSLIGLDRRWRLVDDATRVSIAAATDADAREARLAAHAALRLLVVQYAGQDAAHKPFGRDSFGRPHLDGWSGDFNLSHTADHALVGLTRQGRIGVDIEQLPRTVRMAGWRRQRLIAVAEALAGATARMPASATPNDLDDVRAWTRLEAYAKAQGRGIGHLLARLGVMGVGAKTKHGTPADAAVSELRSDGPELTVHDLALSHPALIGAVACSDATRPEVRQFGELLKRLFRSL